MDEPMYASMCFASASLARLSLPLSLTLLPFPAAARCRTVAAAMRICRASCLSSFLLLCSVRRAPPLCAPTLERKISSLHDARTHCRCTAAGGGRHAHGALCMVCAHTEVACSAARGAPCMRTLRATRRRCNATCLAACSSRLLVEDACTMQHSLRRIAVLCLFEQCALCFTPPPLSFLLTLTSPLSKAQTSPQLSMRVAAASVVIQRTVCFRTLIAWLAEL